jgi:7,8-dihydroneopterin aldolase/epimerase/oxygenase
MASGQWIVVEGIVFRCSIGVSERERQTPQEIVASLELEMDFARAAGSDALVDTVDYREVARRIIAAGEASRFRLLETLATHLCRTILAEFPAVQALRLEVEKPGALRAARAVKAVIATRRPGP